MDTRQLDFEDARNLLQPFGIPILGRMVASVEEAEAAAAELGYPVVLKAVTPEIVHKTDARVVFLNVRNTEQLRRRHEQLLRNAAAAGAPDLDGVLVQRMADPGFEMLVGAKQDPVFGPVILVGYGGRFVELFRDVAPGVGVLTRDDVLRMLSKIRAGRVLEGFRGPALDREAASPSWTRVSWRASR